MEKYVILDLETGFYLGKSGVDILEVKNALMYETLAEAEVKAEETAKLTHNAIRVDKIFLFKQL